MNNLHPDIVRQLIGRISEEFVLLDRKDLPGMAQLCKDLKELAEAIRLISNWPVPEAGAQAAIAAASLIEQIIMEESKDPARDFNRVSVTISAVQTAGNRWGLGGRAAPTAVPELAADGDGAHCPPGRNDGGRAAPPAVSGGIAVNLPAAMDEELLEAFIVQQESVLPDIEGAILAFENDRLEEHVGALRRIIHTMKGEAGVCGITDIEMLCHKLEDYLDAARSADGLRPEVFADILLEVKDWLAQSLEAYRRKEAPAVALDIILKKLVDSREDAGSVTRLTGNPSGAGGPDADPPGGDNVNPVPDRGDVPAIKPIPISDPDLAKDFVGEAHEHFDAADENLIVLENDPANSDAIGAVFRAFHTIKGVSGFLGLPPISALAHVAETLLDEVRKGKRQFAGSVVEVTFSALDMLKIMMADLREALVAGADMKVRPELPALIASLKAVLEGEDALPDADGGRRASAAVPDAATGGDAAHRPPGKGEDGNLRAVGPTAVPGREDAGQPTDVGPVTPPAAAREGIEVGQTMKVDAEKIDLLLDTIGELVIAESIVASDPDIQVLKSLRLEKNMALLGKITRSLQDMGMAMRLVPIDATFRKMARLVRDLSKKSGKQVELIMEGGETEIDKGMVEKLGDPLVHMIRNSIDHGMESSEERKARGKNPVGHVTLRAHHKGGSIHIDIEDDGKGLDREAIVAKAIEKGLLTTGDGMSDQEVFTLIFAAGFSTAKQVTEISGRGVGMDVVRRNIESLRGNVLIRTRLGQGTTFTLVLPLTMAIIDGMLAKVSSEIYVLPTLSIIESFRPTPEMISTVVGRGEMVAFRGALLPLFRLATIFRVPGAIEDPSKAIVIVVEEAGKQWGLLADKILGQQQIVIKSLGEALGTVLGVSGASIMADGRPGLILDIAGVIKLATE